MPNSAKSIDLNSDLGEGYGPWSMGDDEAMLSLVSSANVACGGHAGDPETMFATLGLAKERRVVVGAHPGFPDRSGFGRRHIPMPTAEIERLVAAQCGTLMGIAAIAGVTVRYVKPHGALGNLAARERDVAAAVVRSVKALSAELAILAISGTEMENVAREEHVPVYSEIFADRAYQSNGQLVPRSTEGAVLHDARQAAERLIAFLETGKMPTIEGELVLLAADSICVHGDTADAVAMTTAIRERLVATGLKLAPFLEH